MGANQSCSGSAHPHAGRKLSDSVYEMFKPDNEDEIECEIVFFHGLQMTANKKTLRDAYRMTWMTEDGKECWLKTLLPRAFQNKILVLSVSYDSSMFKTNDTGRFDLFLTGESLVGSIIKNSNVNVGQRGVPVILVGHSFGGFALKQLVFHADHEVESRMHPRKEIAKFLSNLKGVVFYSTPHLGVTIAEYQKYIPSFFRASLGPVLEELQPSSPQGSRLNAKFHSLKRKHDIWSMSLIETQRTQVVSPWSQTVVPEGSSKDYSTEEICPIDADHRTICKPKSENCDRLTHLIDFIQRVKLDHAGLDNGQKP